MYKVKLLINIKVYGTCKNVRNATIAVLLKDLINIWQSLEIPLS